jgi:putative redox protein
VPDTEFVAKVTAIHLRREQVQINFEHGAMIADHDPPLGGDGLGPPPGHILLAALASSTALQVARQAARLGIPVTSVEVGVGSDLSREPAEAPLNMYLRFPRLRKRVVVKGDLTDEQRRTLQLVAEKCVVTNTLRDGAEIEERFEVEVP